MFAVPVSAWREAVRFRSAAAVARSDGEEPLLMRPRFCKAVAEETARRGFLEGVVLGLCMFRDMVGEGGGAGMVIGAAPRTG